MENLEGGIDYLKQVIIDDKLGLAQELENDMNTNVGKYQCEWKTTLESPEKLKRFRHYINSDEMDGNLQFVTVRDQRLPTENKKESLILEQRIDVVEVE